MRNKCDKYKKKQKQLATCLTTSLSSPETTFSFLIRISASQISPLIHYSIQTQESAYPPSKGSAIYSAFECSKHCKEVMKLLLGSRVQAVSKSRNIEKDWFFSLQHIQLDGAFPLCSGLLGPGSSNSHFVFYTTEVHCFNLG